MVFSSSVFLLLFLPILLGLYFIVPRQARNAVLLAGSLFFYTWGEHFYTLIMLGSIAGNYLFGLWIDAPFQRPSRQVRLALAITGNLAILFIFKYTNFLLAQINPGLMALGLSPVKLMHDHLPIGISFFTFQSLSYVIDVYRGVSPVQKNPFHLALYISLFPQLIAGPIVRYHDIARQLVSRHVNLDLFAQGIQRFILGLGKKMLIANTVSVVADQVFSLSPDNLTPSIAWLGALCYTLQIYFDFSGYSDMAIGLGKMFGFHFKENFEYPYISRSIKEFWRRWHISLSTWFRDYLYIALGGNRKGAGRTYFNLVLVFFLCGLWHGANWTFAMWGLYHGVFLLLERLPWSHALGRLWRPIQHVYVLVLVVIGWVLFRADSLPHAMRFVAAMWGYSQGDPAHYNLALYITPTVLLALVAGAMGSMPWLPRMQKAYQVASWKLQTLASGVSLVALGMILVCCMALLAAGTYNPFIYFRF